MTGGRGRLPGRPARLLALALAATALGGCGGEVTELPGRAHAALTAHFDEYARERSPVAEQVPATVRDFRERDRPGAVARPVHIDIPAIGVSSDLDRLDLGDDGVVAAPSEWDTAGWYKGGVRPGQRGAAVILGHVDSTTGPAVFYRLGDLRNGDEIAVTAEDGTVRRFAVRRSGSYRKTRFPTGEVYAPTSTSTLRLVTCTGDFDRDAGHYEDNLVVFADLVG